MASCERISLKTLRSVISELDYDSSMETFINDDLANYHSSTYKVIEEIKHIRKLTESMLFAFPARGQRREKTKLS